MRRGAGRLPRGFYARDTLIVAREMLGCTLVAATPEGRTSGRIVEVEAYHGEEDPACHAAAGLTGRTAPLYGPPGHSYVYLIYGMHHCLNAVAGGEGAPAAVLIRAVEPIDGRDIMRARRETGRRAFADRELASGPGRLCQALGLTLAHNRLDLTGDQLWIERGTAAQAVWSPRIGVAAGADRLWRCFVPDSPGVSRPRTNGRTALRPEPAAG